MGSIFDISHAVDQFQEWGSSKSIKSRKTINTLGIALALSVTAATIGLVAWRKHEVLESARVELSNISSLLSLQTNHALQAIHVTERRVAEQALAAKIKTAGDLVAWASSAEAVTNLKFSTDAVSMLSALAIVDQNGRLISTSRELEKRDVNVSDRKYFSDLRSLGSEMTISGRIVSRLTGQPAIYFARKIANENGPMLGAILAGIDASQIEALFKGVILSQGSSISLINNGGEFIAGFPEDLSPKNIPDLKSAFVNGRAEYRDMNSSFLRDVWGTDEGSLISVSALPDFPLIIVARSEKRAILEQWYNEALIIGALAVLLNISIAVAGYLGLRQLLVAQRIAEAQAYAARHDSLTGLPNRLFLQEYLGARFDQAQDGTEQFVLFLLDLDRFKDVNDTYGHQAGDDLLKAVACRLREVSGDRAHVARLGGDEFAIIHPSINAQEEVEFSADQMLAAMRRPVVIGGRSIVVGASIGTAVALRDARSPGDLFDRADLALYKAKAYGRDQVFYYTEEVEACHQDRLSLLQDLKESIACSALELFFQPIVDLADQRIVAFEALVRWNHPVRGFVPPSRFIPMAEENGLMGPLGQWVIEEACRQARSWPEEIGVAVNLSPVQLQTRDIYVETWLALRASGLRPDRLELEITESVQLEQGGAGDTLHRLRSLGVRIALDDFGTGYASLSYLRSFPFDRLKIDQSFVREMQESRECNIIVETVLNLSHRLGLSVTAEGVETIDQLQILRAAGCTTAQGFLIGHPLVASDVNRFLELWRYPSPDDTAGWSYIDPRVVEMV